MPESSVQKILALRDERAVYGKYKSFLFRCFLVFGYHGHYLFHGRECRIGMNLARNVFDGLRAILAVKDQAVRPRVNGVDFIGAVWDIFTDFIP